MSRVSSDAPPPPDKAPPPVPSASSPPYASQDYNNLANANNTGRPYVPQRTRSKAPPPRTISASGGGGPPFVTQQQQPVNAISSPSQDTDPLSNSAIDSLDEYIRKYADSLPRNSTSASTSSNDPFMIPARSASPSMPSTSSPLAKPYGKPPPRGVSATSQQAQQRRSPPSSLTRPLGENNTSRPLTENSNPLPIPPRRTETDSGGSTTPTKSSFGRQLPQRQPQQQQQQQQQNQTPVAPPRQPIQQSSQYQTPLQNPIVNIPQRSRTSAVPPRTDQSRAGVTNMMNPSTDNSVETAQQQQMKVWARTVKSHHESKVRALEAQQVAEERARVLEGKLSDALDAEAAIRQELDSFKSDSRNNTGMNGSQGNMASQVAAAATDRKLALLQSELDSLLLKHAQTEEKLKNANLRIQTFENKTRLLKNELDTKEKRVLSLAASVQEAERRVADSQSELKDRDAKLRKMRGDRSSTLSEVNVRSSKRVKSLMQGMTELEQLKQMELQDLKAATVSQIADRDAEIDRFKELISMQASDAAAARIQDLETQVATLSNAQLHQQELQKSSSSNKPTISTTATLERRLKTLESNSKLELENLQFQLSQTALQLDDMRMNYEDAEFKVEQLTFQHETTLKDLNTRYKLEISSLKDAMASSRASFEDERDSLLTEVFNLENLVEGMKKMQTKEIRRLGEVQKQEMEALRSQLMNSVSQTGGDMDQLKAAKQSLEATVRIVTQEKEALALELDSVTDQLDALSVKQAEQGITYKSDVAELKEELESMRAANAELDITCVRLKGDASTLRATVERLEAERSADAERLQTEALNWDQERGALEAELNEVNEEFVGMIAALKVAEASKSNLEKEVAALQKKVAAATQSASADLADRGIAESSLAREFEAEKARFEDELNLAKKEMDSLKQLNSDLRAANDASAGTSPELEAALDEIQSLKDMLEDLNADYETLESNYRDLQSAQNNSNGSIVADLEQKLVAANAEITALAQELQEKEQALNVAKEEIVLLQTSNDAAKWSLSEVQDALETERAAKNGPSSDKLAAEIDTLKAQLKESLVEIVEANDYISQLEDERKSRADSKDSSRDMAAIPVNNTEELDALKQEMKSQLAVAAEDLQEITIQLSLVQKEKAVLLGQLKSTEEYSIKCREEYATKESQMQSTIVNLQKSLNDSLIRLESLQQSVNGGDAELIQQLESEIEGLNKDLDNADADLQDLQTQMDNYVDTVKELEEREIFLEDQVDARDVQLRSLEARFLQQGVQLELAAVSEKKYVVLMQSIAQSDESASKIAQLQQLIDSLTQELEEIESQNVNLQETIKDLEATNDSLESALEASRSETESFEDKIADLRTQLTQVKEDLEDALDERDAATAAANISAGQRIASISPPFDTAEIEQLEKEVLQLRKVVDFSQAQLRTLESKFLTRGLAVERLEKSLFETEKQLWASTAALNESWTRSMSQSRGAPVGDINENEDRSDQTEALQYSLEASKAETNALEWKYQALSAQFETLQKSYDATMRDMRALQSQFPNSPDAKDDASQRSSMDSEVTLALVNEQFDSFKAQTRVLEAKILTQGVSLEVAAKADVAQAAVIASLKEELALVEADLQDALDQLQKMPASIDNENKVSSVVEVGPESNTRIKSLEKDLEVLNTHLDLTKAQMRALEARYLTQGISLESCLRSETKLTAVVSNLQENLIYAQQDLDDAVTQLRRMSTTNSERSSLDVDALRQKDERIQSLLEKAEDSEDQNEQLKMQVQTYLNAVESLQDQVSMLEAALAKSRQRTEELDAKLSDSDEEREGVLQEKITSLTGQVNGLKEANDSLFAKLKESEAKLESVKGSGVGVVGGDVGIPGASVEATAGDVAALYEKIAKLSEQRDVLQEQNELLISKLEQLQAKLPDSDGGPQKKKGFFF
ncbi:hypothetical protein HDU80_006830 [Chytriomyces hyalinus]|nr:hypothetical protein HDU80_006830 [Chytriomyces hyalinus]